MTSPVIQIGRSVTAYAIAGASGAVFTEPVIRAPVIYHTASMGIDMGALDIAPGFSRSETAARAGIQGNRAGQD